MKAAWYSENGGPEVLHYGEVADPVVGARSVLVRVAWISIEGGDLLNRVHTPPARVPFVPGYQASGEVVAVGDEVSRVRVGDRVVAFDWGGSHAELFCVPEHYVYPVPEGMALQAATDEVVQKELATIHGDGGVIALTPDGQMAWSFNTPGMFRARLREGCTPQISIYRDEP